MILENEPYKTTFLEAEKLHQNNSIDIISPFIAMTDITLIVCEMLEENIIYTKKFGLTEPAKKSRERLLKLLNITEIFNLISSKNESLKLYNKELFGENCLLKSQLFELKRQENLGNSL